MKGFLLLLFLFIIPQISFAKIGKEECEEFDYRSRFGPVQDQDGHGLCWAFAASSLLSEDLCIRDNSKCGINLSPLDVSSCRKSILKMVEGGFIDEGIDCAIENGVCNQYSFDYLRGANQLCNFVFNQEVPHCMHSALQQLYFKYTSLNISFDQCDQPILDYNKNYQLDNIVKQIKDLTIHGYSSFQLDEQGIKKIILNKKITNWSDFLYEILENSSCKKNKFQFKNINQYATKEFSEKMNNQEKMNAIKSLLSNGRSIGIGFCATQAMYHSWMSKILGEEKQCGGHAAVVNGMRWNKEQKRCEIYIRNSWGYNKSLAEWVDADFILPYTRSIGQIESK